MLQDAAQAHRSSGIPTSRESKNGEPPGRSGERERSRRVDLLRDDEMCSAVLLPALFVALRASRLFLAVADGTDARGRDAQLHKCVLCGRGAIVAEREIVLGRSAFVAMTLDGEVNVGMLLQVIGIRLQNGLVARAHSVRVIIEVNVLHILRKRLFFGEADFRWLLRGRPVDGDARGGFLRAAGTLGKEVISGGLRGRNLLGTAGVDRAEPVDCYVSGIRCLPAEGGRLTRVHRVRVRG
jgi:hypothetical protein